MAGTSTRWLLAALITLLAAMPVRGEVPTVIFDIPLIAECRDVTPKGFRDAYQRDIIEAVFRISPELIAGEEKDLKRLHYEISTGQQMPVVSYLPSAQVATDVVDGAIAIQKSSYHGELSVRYLILPTNGNGDLKGDLNASHAQFTLLAPRQLLLATGTIERGYGVYFDLRPSTQDTLQKPREFACLFDVPAAWRADYVTVRCKSAGTKHVLGGLVDSEVVCGSALLCVGLYRQDDGEARAYAEMLARKQQVFFNRLATQTKPNKMTSFGDDPKSFETLGALGPLSSAGTTKAKLPRTTAVGSAILSSMEEGEAAPLPDDAKAAGDEVNAARDEVRRLNGKKG